MLSPKSLIDVKMGFTNQEKNLKTNDQPQNATTDPNPAGNTSTEQEQGNGRQYKDVSISNKENMMEVMEFGVDPPPKSKKKVRITSSNSRFDEYIDERFELITSEFMKTAKESMARNKLIDKRNEILYESLAQNQAETIQLREQCRKYEEQLRNLNRKIDEVDTKLIDKLETNQKEIMSTLNALVGNQTKNKERSQEKNEEIEPANVQPVCSSGVNQEDTWQRPRKKEIKAVNVVTIAKAVRNVPNYKNTIKNKKEPNRELVRNEWIRALSAKEAEGYATGKIEMKIKKYKLLYFGGISPVAKADKSMWTQWLNTKPTDIVYIRNLGNNRKELLSAKK